MKGQRHWWIAGVLMAASVLNYLDNNDAGGLDERSIRQCELDAQVHHGDDLAPQIENSF